MYVAWVTTVVTFNAFQMLLVYDSANILPW